MANIDLKDLKIRSVHFRETVGLNSKSGVTSLEAELESHPAGVVVRARKGEFLQLVPYSNCRWISYEVPEEAKKA